MAMVDNPLVSIILLCFNHEKFVAEALDGVLTQNYSPVEVVIIDDCSSDKTVDIIETTLARRPNRLDVKLIRHPKNMSGEVGCQTGLTNTKGDFVLISAGDDVMLPDMVSEMVGVWQKEAVSLVATNACYIDEDSNPLGRTFRDPNVPADDSFETLARDGGNACCFGPTIGFERELYTAFGWPPSMFLGAYDIMLPFYAYLAKGARFIKKPLLKYRVHARNTSLSLMWEKSDRVGQLLLNEQMYNSHLAHAVLFRYKIDQLRAQMPSRYADLAERIMPLVTIQIVEMASKLVRTRIELDQIRRNP